MKVGIKTVGRYSTRIVVRETGITTHYLRQMEREGLLSPGRIPGGHRLYTRADLAVIRRALELRRKGFSLDNIPKYLKTSLKARVTALKNNNKK